ncbi:Suppressor of glycerol defect protein 1 [Neolecta irregularis DAH-3]|uniref:Suppressor of glycerol defect protein 1 n=1 Tax=Neolecta irregularis (strain DAH-3) TaxID=1198029 RepID=A0A1U7LTK2_NEOID|nr:Suppressor of glycerol defect protein 1 [Neolecta irregularis DAH-3]|eukprot:OLL25913.1 Suppressor of glycerol defect protein 1 [Neolecta irregularis DAH-3]
MKQRKAYPKTITRLPKNLRDELGLGSIGTNRKNQDELLNRKSCRVSVSQQRQVRNSISRKRKSENDSDYDIPQRLDFSEINLQQRKKSDLPVVKSILNKSRDNAIALATSSMTDRVSDKAIEDALAQEDSKIAHLERKLNIKNISSSNKFVEDGLDALLEGLDELRKPQSEPAKPLRPSIYQPAIPSGAKYIPPSVHKALNTPLESEDTIRLRRQLKGLLNRLSEANLAHIITEIEALYRSNPRQILTSNLTSLIITIISSHSHLLEAFVILHAALIAALYRSIGVSFAAYFVQTLVEQFDKFYDTDIQTQTAEQSAKECSNIIVLLCELYNFQVVGCTLLYDIIRSLLNHLSEVNTELLLKIVRSKFRFTNETLRSIFLERNRYSDANQDFETRPNIFRTKFMVETILNLKNNRVKAGDSAGIAASEATSRMKKFLGGLITYKNSQTAEPLRVSLSDIRSSETKGKWWLVGASWTGGLYNRENDDIVILEDDSEKLTELAKSQRMNTDVRRMIFIAIMSSEDYIDACDRISKLGLKKAQQQEIPRVLIHCCGNEKSYNPFYAFISMRLCSQYRSFRLTFQFRLWDFFRNLGEDIGDEGGSGINGQNETVSLRKIANLAKLYGFLIANQAINLVLTFQALRDNTKTFLEVMFQDMFLHSQKYSPKRNVLAIVEIVGKLKGHQRLARGIGWFIRKYIRKGIIGCTEDELAIIKWASEISLDALKAVACVT